MRMDLYMLSLFVTLEQELAIRELFVYRRWNFLKTKDNAESQGVDTLKSIQTGDQSSNDSSELGSYTRKCQDSHNTGVPEVKVLHQEVFSDLQDFVEATLNESCLSDKSDSDDDDCDDEYDRIGAGKSIDISEENKSLCNGSLEISDNHHSDISVWDKHTDTCDNGKNIIVCNVIDDDDYDDDDDDDGKDEVYDDLNAGNVNYHQDHVNKVIDVESKYVNGNSDELTTDKALTVTDNMLSDKESTELTVQRDIDEHKCSNTENMPDLKAVGKNSSTIQDNVTVDNSSEMYSCSDICNKDVECDDKILLDNSVMSPRSPVCIVKKHIADPEHKSLKHSSDKMFKNGHRGSDKKVSKIGSFYCKDCDNTYHLLGAYKNHKHNGRCRFECEFCGKRFTSRYYSNYKSHLRNHRKDRPHSCIVCNKSYTDLYTLNIHTRTHSGVRPYMCQHCGQQFYSSSHLTSHENSIHSEPQKRYTCNICKATLTTSGNLRVHLNSVHNNERPFTCEICGKSFKTQQTLEKIHSKVHMNVYPFVCDYIGCGKKFKRSGCYNEHVRRHNNQRSHFCKNCGKGFYSKKELNSHTRIHTGEKPYNCNICDYKCALIGNLQKHMKIHVT
ncbi:hypothetical protein ACF0H5_009927 [Mactra antiquata]